MRLVEHSSNVSFNYMLEASIPDPLNMRYLTNVLAARYATSPGLVIDLGCGTGKVLHPLLSILGSNFSYLGLDNDPIALAKAKESFPKVKNASFELLDLGKEFPLIPHSPVMIASLLLMFLPLEEKTYLVKQVIKNLRDDGVFLVVEKLSVPNRELASLYSETHQRLKYPQDSLAYANMLEREKERLYLQGEWELRNLLAYEGFDEIECYWRFLNFAAYICTF